MIQKRWLALAGVSEPGHRGALRERAGGPVDAPVPARSRRPDPFRQSERRNSRLLTPFLAVLGDGAQPFYSRARAEPILDRSSQK